MTETSKALLEHHQVRKTKTQKAAFFQWVKPLAEAKGYRVTTEKGTFGAKNIIIGDPDTAKVVFTAHYDTCAVMPVPNFITPTQIFCYLLYQLLLITGIVLLAALFTVVWIRLGLPLASVFFSLALWTMLLLLILGPANKHTANDNTSGVATVLDILENMPEELQNQAAFVLFDLEEAGLFGSASFFGNHKKAMRDKLLLNFDCVSDGDHLLFCIKKKAHARLSLLEKAFPASQGKTVRLCTKGFFYPSDQANFPCGIGIAALKKGPFGVLYMDRIHTPKDTVFQAENITMLSQGAVRLTRLLTGESVL